MNSKIKIGRHRVVVTENLLDKAIRTISPQRGLERFRARAQAAVMVALAGGYEGAKKGKRWATSWIASDGDADADLLPDLPALRARTRDLSRNNPIACGAINTVATNVVGTGLRPQARIDRDYLGLTDEQADSIEEDIERRFRLFAESKECDVARTLNFYGHQYLAFVATLESGDAIYLLPFIERAGSVSGIKLQAIEADRLCNENYAADTDRLAGGVEADVYGAPINYHIARAHPGALRPKSLKWDVVPAYGAESGRRNVLHLFEQRRPGQRRGVPYLAPVIEALKQIGRYTEAELMAAVVSGMFTVFIKSESGDTPLALANNAQADSSKPDNYELGYGAMIGLGNTESIETANPGRPNAAFDPFVLAILRQIGAALEIPFELLIKHFTASYSAAQAAFLEAWKFFNRRRRWLVDNFCQPVYEAWMDEEVASGRLYAPGYFEDELTRQAYLGTEWIGPPRGQIDEVKAVDAAEKRINLELSTRAGEAAALNGGDWSKIHRQRVKEERLRKADGLTSPAPAPATADPTDPDDADRKDTQPE